MTHRCLIAADVDKTLLLQTEREKEEFFAGLATELIRAAYLGTHLAFLTGNDMNELSSRFLNFLIDQLCRTNRLWLLERLHFFSNSGGVYSHFSDPDDKELQRTLRPRRDRTGSSEKVFDALTVQARGGKRAIRPRFVDSAYIERCRIPNAERTVIRKILSEEADRYRQEVESHKADYAKIYDFSKIYRRQTVQAKPDLRAVKYQSGGAIRSATVQVTLRPVLSFRQARDQAAASDLVDQDLRSKLTASIQKRLDESGLSHYVARPGGRSSIDVTIEKVDKAFALEFLIDRLNLQGTSRRGQYIGSNTMYLGDEVIAGHGNDYPVTRIPGSLVFAVNPERDLVPLLSHVLVPSAILEGPDAVSEVLHGYNNAALRLMAEFDNGSRDVRNINTALDSLKKELFVNRIDDKLTHLEGASHLSVDDWQSLHAFVTRRRQAAVATRAA